MKSTKEITQLQPKILQALEIENNCKGLFSEGEFFFKPTEVENLVSENSIAWKHSSILDKEEERYTYLSLYIPGLGLEEYSSSPEKLKKLTNRIRFHKKAAQIAKIDFSDICFFDSLPNYLVRDWFTMRTQALGTIYENVPRPGDYNIMHKIHVLATKISKQKIQVQNLEEQIKYDIFSSSTGRLTTEKGTFPILNISKQNRTKIVPQNDMFLEIDLNGAEIRTLLGFSGERQPEYDIHEFNSSILEVKEREQAKIKFFAWLYNPSARNYKLEKIYNKQIYEQFYTEGIIKTPFGRDLTVEDRKALNYLIQSTTSDIVLENSYRIMKYLQDRRSSVAFTMHDSVVLDFSKEDFMCVPDIKQMFERNLFGNFLASISIGKNFGEMRKVQL